jgi:GWxTD domain-containing protein
MRGTIDLLMILAVFSFGSVALGADLASVSRGDVRFGIDTALFDYTGTDTLGMEVYQQLDLQQFSMDQDSFVSFTTTVVLMTVSGDTTAVDQWNSETIWVPGRSAVNSTVLPVVSGDYALDVTVTDNGNGLQGGLSRDITVESLGGISDIELARAVVPAPAGSTNPLRKGELLVYPAADGSFTLPEEHKAYYYVELYDLGGNTVQIQGRLETSSGEIIFARPWVSVTIPEGADAVGLVDSLDLQVARNSGLHRLVFGLIAQGDTLETEKFLVVGRAPEQVSETQEGFDETADIPYPGQFTLILSATELSIYDNLDDQARNRFYAAYWQGSPDQRVAFEQRCSEAEKYSSPYKEGWRTDRGRVYIIYGPPDDIDAVLFQGEQVPYEIWYYYGRGNERFVFADRNGTGDYEQVFSTIEGEVSYTNWEDMITPISGGGGG